MDDTTSINSTQKLGAAPSFFSMMIDDMFGVFPMIYQGKSRSLAARPEAINGERIFDRPFGSCFNRWTLRHRPLRTPRVSGRRGRDKDLAKLVGFSVVWHEFLLTIWSFQWSKGGGFSPSIFGLQEGFFQQYPHRLVNMFGKSKRQRLGLGRVSCQKKHIWLGYGSLTMGYTTNTDLIWALSRKKLAPPKNK